MKNRRQEGIRADRLERTKKTVAGRIAHVCEHFSRENFEVLITRIAEIEIKYSMRDHVETMPPGYYDEKAGSGKKPGPT